MGEDKILGRQSLFVDNNTENYTKDASQADQDFIKALLPVFEAYGGEFRIRELMSIALGAVSEVGLSMLLGWDLPEYKDPQ
jgi:hypothetical protein